MSLGHLLRIKKRLRGSRVGSHGVSRTGSSSWDRSQGKPRLIWPSESLSQSRQRFCRSRILAGQAPVTLNPESPPWESSLDTMTKFTALWGTSHIMAWLTTNGRRACKVEVLCHSFCIMTSQGCTSSKLVAAKFR